MLRLTIKGLWAHKLRFALTGLAVVLGVAFMAGTMVLTDTMERTFDGIFASANEDIDVVVQQPSVEGEGVAVRERVPAAVLDTVRSVDGVAAAAGTIQGFAQLVMADGEVDSLDGFGMTIGTNWVDEAVSPLELASGRAPQGPAEAVIDAATAEREGWELGDAITVLSKAEPRELTLVGTARYGAIEGLPGASVVAVEDAVAQELFGEPGAYDTIAVRATTGIASDDLAARIGDALDGSGLDVLTGAQDTADKQADMHDDLSFFNTFLLAFAYVSLFVGTFIIYNTFSIVLAQRSRNLAMLRAIGAGRRQVLGSIVGEAALIGLVASAVGLGLGVLMSFGLRGLLSAVGLDLPSGGIVVSSATVVTAFVVGLTVTLASAIAPALRASRIAPIAALRDAAVEKVAPSLGRIVAGVLLSAGSVVAFAAGTVAGGAEAMPLLGLGAFGTIVGVFVLGPVLVRPALRWFGRPAGVVSGTVGHLGIENARRNPKRTAATASALMIGVALVGFISILASSTKSSVADAVDRSFRADFVVDSGSWGLGGLSPALAEQLEALPETTAVSSLRSAPAIVQGDAVTLFALDTTVAGELVDLDVTAGSLDAVTDGHIALQRDVADERDLVPGDAVRVDFTRTGSMELVVAAIYDDDIPGVGASDWLVDLATFEANVSDQFDRQIYVATDDAVTADAARTALEGALEEWPNAELQDQASFKESITSQIDQLLNLVYGLLALAVVIALIGIANTLALSVHERTRELGLLRAIGMSRRQVRTTVRWEAALIALLGAAAGIALAIGAAWGVVRALASEGVGAMTLPVGTLGVIVAVGGIAGVLAATGPARRAARLDVLRAIATE